jgi:hypothetical protein
MFTIFDLQHARLTKQLERFKRTMTTTASTPKRQYYYKHLLQPLYHHRLTLSSTLKQSPPSSIHSPFGVSCNALFEQPCMSYRLPASPMRVAALEPKTRHLRARKLPSPAGGCQDCCWRWNSIWGLFLACKGIICNIQPRLKLQQCCFERERRKGCNLPLLLSRPLLDICMHCAS